MCTKGLSPICLYCVFTYHIDCTPDSSVKITYCTLNSWENMEGPPWMAECSPVLTRNKPTCFRSKGFNTVVSCLLYPFPTAPNVYLSHLPLHKINQSICVTIGRQYYCSLSIFECSITTTASYKRKLHLETSPQKNSFSASHQNICMYIYDRAEKPCLITLSAKMVKCNTTLRQTAKITKDPQSFLYSNINSVEHVRVDFTFKLSDWPSFSTCKLWLYHWFL